MYYCINYAHTLQAANAEVERMERRGANVIFYFQSVSTISTSYSQAPPGFSTLLKSMLGRGVWIIT